MLIEKILKVFNIETTPELLEQMTNKDLTDDVSNEIEATILKGAQEYSKPFFEDSNSKTKEELKGQYFQDASRQLFKQFSGLITESERMEAFKKGGFQEVAKLINERNAEKNKGGGDGVNDDLKATLEVANTKIEELQGQLDTLEQTTEKKYQDIYTEKENKEFFTKHIEKKLNARTDKNVQNLSRVFVDKYFNKSFIAKRNGDSVDLFDVNNPESILKNDTKVIKIDSFIDTFVTDWDLKPKVPTPPTPPTPIDVDLNKTQGSGFSDAIAKLASAKLAEQ